MCKVIRTNVVPKVRKVKLRIRMPLRATKKSNWQDNVSMLVVHAWRG